MNPLIEQLLTVLSDPASRMSVVERTRHRDVMIVELGLLDVDCQYLHSQNDYTAAESMLCEIEHYEKELGMR